MLRSHMRMSHRADVYTKSYTENDAGQKRGKWTLTNHDAKCFFTPTGSTVKIRVSPTAEEAEWHTLYFANDSGIDYGTRVSNVRTFKGELIIPGPLQVMKIDRHVSSFSGIVQYFQVTLKTVIE